MSRRRAWGVVMAQEQPGFVRPPTTQEAVLAVLRQAILQGAVPPGTPLVQEEIAQRFRLSRVPVREALRRLEGEGHVVYRPRRGYVVAGLTPDDFAELSRLRELLETDAVRRTMARPGSCDLTAMRRLFRDLDAAARDHDPVAYARADRAFHLALVEPAGRAWLTRVVAQVWDACGPYLALLHAAPDHHARERPGYEALLAAVAAYDAERVLALLGERRARAIAAVTTALRDRDGGAVRHP
ncbi:MAG: FCD domain-containing protein [Streptosporangiales bacterium]|nr:FCD domain-containing protein [Streptosporangiales bacterium]